MVILRPLTKEDLPFLLEVRNDDSTRKNLENDSIFTLDQCQSWFDNLKSPWYIIEVNRFPVGYLRTNGDEVGCDIHPDFRRKGYARMAYELYLKDKTYASLWVFNDNFAKNLYKKLGFKETGDAYLLRDRIYLKMIYTKNEFNRNPSFKTFRTSCSTLLGYAKSYFRFSSRKRMGNL